MSILDDESGSACRPTGNRSIPGSMQ